MTSILNASVFPSLFSESPRGDLAPPSQGRWLGPMGLAVLAHLLLLAALTWGVSWQHDSAPVVIEAELWSKLPVEAAPRAAAPPPRPPAPAPELPAKPEPKPAPVPPAPPAPSQAEIAVQEAKKKKAEEALRLAELQKAQAAKAAEARAAAAKKEAAEKQAAAEKARQDKLAQAKKEIERKAMEAAAAEAREQQLARMMGQAGASGNADSKGAATRASGPSASYGQKLAAAFKRNIYYANPESIAGNPKAEVLVSVGPTGQVIASKLTRSSGVSSWDDAVLRAAERTTIPPDENGKFPSQFPVVFGPKD